MDKLTLNDPSLVVWFGRWAIRAIKKSMWSQYFGIRFLFVGAIQLKETEPTCKTSPHKWKKKMMKVLAEGFEQKVQGKCQVIVMKFLSFHIGLLNGDDLS